jgi:heme exporter protein B
MFIRWINTFKLILSISFRSFLIRKTFWLASLIFALCLLILFPFSLGIPVVKKPDVQVGCLWAIMEFVAALCVSRMFSVEQEAQALDVILSSRSPRSAILFAKIFFTAVFIFTLQIPIVFFWFVLFNVNASNLTFFILNLFGVSVFFSFGTASLGALIYSLTVRSQAKEILQPILFFPLQTGLLLASVSVTLAANSIELLSSAFNTQAWWTLLISYPIIFSSIGLIFSFNLFEE